MAFRIFNIRKRKKIALRYDQLGIIYLDWDGNIIDRDSYYHKYISSLSGNDIIFESIRILETNSDLKIIIPLMEKGLQHSETTPYTKGIGYKFLGELFESTGENKEACLNYEKALEINPKIGVKKKIAQLRILLSNAI